jgi:lysylphosphatidylglycerol synthetase-like protein (DUF2156 family)
MRSVALLRILAIVPTGLIFALSFAHLMELPGKLRLDGTAWLTVQQNLYIAFGTAGAILEPLAIGFSFACAAVLWWRGKPAGLPLLAGVLTLAALIECALVVSPMNSLLNGWTPATLPPDWTRCRNQWELGHAIHSVLFGAALVALFASALQERSGRERGRSAPGG